VLHFALPFWIIHLCVYKIIAVACHILLQLASCFVGFIWVPSQQKIQLFLKRAEQMVPMPICYPFYFLFYFYQNKPATLSWETLFGIAGAPFPFPWAIISSSRTTIVDANGNRGTKLNCDAFASLLPKCYKYEIRVFYRENNLIREMEN
jgi:hypothetical protein